MKCVKCGCQIEEHDGFCPGCRQEDSIKVLSRAERDNFGGQTIEISAVDGFDTVKQNNNYYEYNNEYDGNGYNRSNYGSRIYRFNILPTGFWGKGALFLATGLLIFVALPIFFLALLMGVVFWKLFFKKR